MLNEPPFHENISLVGLDEMTTFDLGDLVFKIFKYLNPDININARQTQPQEIIFQVTEFLRILSYESEFSPEWESGLLNGDRKIIYPIYYFLLKNAPALKKRAYLAKFLVPLDIPADYVGDPELKRLNEQMKELQAEFQIVHEEFEGIESSSLVRLSLSRIPQNSRRN
jgi:intraflagellar transport protein 81